MRVSRRRRSGGRRVRVERVMVEGREDERQGGREGGREGSVVWSGSAL